MKFAFILDTSPLMQIKKSVIGEFPSKRSEEAKSDPCSLSEDSTSTTTGMSFFEQSIYAIEEFITVRKKMAAWKQDKYVLALTASNPESNAAVEIEIQLEDAKEEIADEDAAYFQIEKSGEVHSTKILSNLWHPFRHFMA